MTELEQKTAHETFLKAVAELRSANENMIKTEAERKQISDRLNARIDELEVKMKRNAIAPVGSDEAKEKNRMEMKAWIKGVAGMRLTEDEKAIVAERKTLTLGDDTQAGYLAPKEFVNQIIKAIIPFSPIRQLATVRQTSMKEVMIPRRTAPLAAAWVNQGGTKAEDTALRYGLEKIVTHKLVARKDIEEEQLQDSAFDLEAEMNAEFSEQFGIAEGTAFVGGTNVNQPEGLLSNASILSTAVKSGSASTLTGDGLINLAYALKSGYAKNASWLMRRATVGVIRSLKDPVTGRYLWEPALNLGEPSTLIGYPVIEAPDMPLSSVGSNYPILFGDFRRAYYIVDRVAINVLRDPYSAATTGIIRFIATKRVGGQVVLPEAVIPQVVGS